MAVTGIDKFVVGPRVQREWAWLITLAFFFGGAGAGAFLVSSIIGYTPGVLIGLGIVAIGKNTAHMMYLGKPLRFWRAFSRPQKSWVSRGIYLVTVFLVFGIVYALPLISGLEWLPWGASTVQGKVIYIIAALGALGVTVYTGFLMAYSPGIAFWNTALLPILFLLYAVMGGIAIIFATAQWSGNALAGVSKNLESLEMVLLIIALLFLLAHVLSTFSSSLSRKESAKILITGRLAPLFLGGVVGAGLIIPFIIALTLYVNEISIVQAAPIMVIAGVLDLGGSILLRYCLLRAGTYSPVI